MMLLINVLTGMPVVTLVALSQKYTSGCIATVRAFGGASYLRGLPIGRFASSALFVIVVPFPLVICHQAYHNFMYQKIQMTTQLYAILWL